MFNIIIFSKNRPAQLELLLRSMNIFYVGAFTNNVSVLYKIESSDTQQNIEITNGYDIVKGKYESVNFIEEDTFLKNFADYSNFKNQTIELINPGLPYTQFFVDDQVFIRPFSIECEQFALFNRFKPSMYSMSLRLGKNIDYCYSLNIKTRLPIFHASTTAYNWQNCFGDWGYPMSVDGNIFFTEDILTSIKAIDFYHPNSLEGGLFNNPFENKPLSICLPSSVVINVPANKVQSDYQNRSMNVNIREMNNLFLDGAIIDLNLIAGGEYNAPHVELEYKWVKND